MCVFSVPRRRLTQIQKKNRAEKMKHSTNEIGRGKVNELRSINFCHYIADTLRVRVKRAHLLHVRSDEEIYQPGITLPFHRGYPYALPA